MKKIKFSIRLFAIVLGLLLCMQMSSYATTGKSTGANVRIRKSASTDAEVIDLLGLDETVEILSKEGDWYKVSFKGKTGYVSQSLISTNEEIEANNSPEVNNQNVENNENSEGLNEQGNTNLENTDQQNSENTDQQNNENSENSDGQNNENSNNEQNNNQNVDENTNQTTTNETESNTVQNKVYKMAENADINILPVVTSEHIGEVKKDDEVTLISNAGLWVFIKAENVNGWIRIDKLSAENVSVGNGNPNGEDTDNNETTDNNENGENTENNQNTDNEIKNDENTNNEAENDYAPKTMYSKVEAVNVRSEANTSSEVVSSIGLNTEIKVIGEENGWYKVEVDGKSGYIRNDLLSNEKTEVTSRSNDIDRNAVVNQNSSEQTQMQTNTSTALENSVAEKNTENVVTTTAENQTSSVPTSSTGVTGNDIVEYAKQFLGCRYVYGAAGPSSFDCSGLTMYVYKHFGYSLSHSSKVQATQGTAVTGDLQPGDILVFSNDGRTVGHVGIYIGNDQFIHASDSSTGVIISRLSDKWNKSKYWGARRIL